MNALTITTLALGASLAFTGCQRSENTTNESLPKSTAVSQSSTPAPASAFSPNDPSLPPHGTPASPEQKADAHPTSELTKGERDKALPLEGQVNNYNSDAFAKRGNDRISREPSPAADTTVKEQK